MSLGKIAAHKDIQFNKEIISSLNKETKYLANLHTTACPINPEMNVWTIGLHILVENIEADRAMMSRSQFSSSKASSGLFHSSIAQFSSATFLQDSNVHSKYFYEVSVHYISTYGRD